MKRLFVPGSVALAVVSAGVWATYKTCPGNRSTMHAREQQLRVDG